MNIWKAFETKKPKLAKWVREGGLFVIVSNLITVLKYFMLPVSSLCICRNG